MKKILTFSLLLVSWTLSLQAQVFNFSALFEQSLKFNDSYLNAELDEKISKEQRSSAYSTVLPSISLNASYLKRDLPSSVAGFSETTSASYLSISQNLFQGGAEYKAIDIADNLPKIAKYAKDVAKLQLFSEYSALYFDAFFSQELVKLLEKQEQLLSAQVFTTRKRVKIGRSKQSDLLSVTARKARVTAQLSQARSQRITNLEKLKQFSGVNQIGRIVAPEFSKALPEASSVVIDNHPSLKYLDLVHKNSVLTAKATRGEYYPDLSLDGNIYGQREGSLKDSKWDVTVSASWNIYSGGASSASEKEALYEAGKVYNQLRRAKNDIRIDRRRYLEKLNFDKVALNDMAKAEKLAERNYREFIKEEKKSLVNQLEVLRATEDYIEISKSHLEAKKQYLSTQVALAISYGETL